MPEYIYIGYGKDKGKTVHESDAFEYAKTHLDELDETDRKDFTEWFFSGAWRKEMLEDE